MFVNRRLDNSDPLAKISPEIMQKIEATTTTIGVATSNNTPDTIVKRDGTGGFSAGTIKATAVEVSGSAKIALPLKDSAGVNIIDIGATNCMIGKNVLNNLNAAASGSTAVGVNIGGSNDGGNVNNTFFGRDIAQNVNGAYAYCTAAGYGALKNVNAWNNTAVGFNALSELTTGLNNTGFGIRTGTAHTSITTGQNNTFVGATAGSDSPSRMNGTAIGQNARVDFDNCVQLGNTLVNQVRTSGTLYALGLESIGNTLNIASANNTNTVNIGSGTSVQTINMGNTGAGATVINIGGAGDTVNISGTLNNITTTNTQVADKSLVLNSGGAASTAGTSGIYFEEAGSSANSYMRVSSDRSKIELKAPTGSNITLNQSLSNTDAAVFSSVTATTVSASGNVSSSTGPTASNHLTTKAYVDGLLPGIQYLTMRATMAGPYTLVTAQQPFFNLARIGNVVTVTLTAYINIQIVNNPNPTFFSNTEMLPVAFRPIGGTISFACKVYNASKYEMGTGEIGSDGTITIGTSYEKDRYFTVGQNASFNGFTTSYVVTA